LHDGDHAFEIMRQLLKPAFKNEVTYEGVSAVTYPDLFGAHPTLQIDSNSVGAAVIAEILLQYHDGDIHLLPTLPTVCKDCKVIGLKARGNIAVDIVWKDGKVVDYKVDGKKGEMVKIIVNDVMKRVEVL